MARARRSLIPPRRMTPSSPFLAPLWKHIGLVSQDLEEYAAYKEQGHRPPDEEVELLRVRIERLHRQIDDLFEFEPAEARPDVAAEAAPASAPAAPASASASASAPAEAPAAAPAAAVEDAVEEEAAEEEAAEAPPRQPPDDNLTKVLRKIKENQERLNYTRTDEWHHKVEAAVRAHHESTGQLPWDPRELSQSGEPEAAAPASAPAAAPVSAPVSADGYELPVGPVDFSKVFPDTAAVFAEVAATQGLYARTD